MKLYDALINTVSLDTTTKYNRPGYSFSSRSNVCRFIYYQRLLAPFFTFTLVTFFYQRTVKHFFSLEILDRVCRGGHFFLTIKSLN